MQHQENHNIDNENSCKTVFTDIMTNDTNSTSYHKGFYLQKNSFQQKGQFNSNTLITVQQYEDQIKPVQKKSENQQKQIQSIVLEKTSKSQRAIIFEKSLKATIQKRKIQVKKLLGAQSLRQKFGHLLPDDMKLKIGYFHHKLIQKMCCIDRCITILNKGSSKSLSLKSIQDGVKSMKEIFQDSDLKQIIFLNDNYGQLYHIGWSKKQNTGDYQLTVRLPFMTVHNDSQRKCLFRKTIMKFLMTKYFQFLRQNSIIIEDFNVTPTKWDYGFNVQDIRIPMSNIPSHPLEKKLSLSQMDKDQLNNIRNKDLKQIIEDVISLNQKQKQKYQQASFKQPTPFKHKLYKIIKSKQQDFQHEKKLTMIQQKSVQTKQLIQFCHQACAFYIQRKVNTMFLMSFLQSMKKRMQLNSPLSEVEKILDQILQMPIQYLIKIQSPKGTMIQIKRQRYNELLKYLETNE